MCCLQQCDKATITSKNNKNRQDYNRPPDKQPRPQLPQHSHPQGKRNPRRQKAWKAASWSATPCETTKWSWMELNGREMSENGEPTAQSGDLLARFARSIETTVFWIKYTLMVKSLFVTCACTNYIFKSYPCDGHKNRWIPNSKIWDARLAYLFIY